MNSILSPRDIVLSEAVRSALKCARAGRADAIETGNPADIAATLGEVERLEKALRDAGIPEDPENAEHNPERKTFDPRTPSQLLSDVLAMVRLFPSLVEGRRERSYGEKVRGAAYSLERELASIPVGVDPPDFSAIRQRAEIEGVIIGVKSLPVVLAFLADRCGGKIAVYPSSDRYEYVVWAEGMRDTLLRFILALEESDE